MIKEDRDSMPGHVFISYSHGQDSSYVRRLAAHLTSLGIPVWFDEEIVIGDRWERDTREKLDACAVFVVVMTPVSEDSVWVSREIQRAEQSSKPILPILLRGRPFLRLGDYQYENVVGSGLPGAVFVAQLRAYVEHDAFESGRGGSATAVAYRFAGVDYCDPRELTSRMTHEWKVARDHVGRQAASLDTWLKEYVRDPALSTNILQDGSEDQRIARLFAHFNSDKPPVFHGRRVDVLGVLELCIEAETGAADSYALLMEMMAATGLLEIFATHSCQAGHPQCGDQVGCAVLLALPMAWQSTMPIRMQVIEAINKVRLRFYLSNDAPGDYKAVTQQVLEVAGTGLDLPAVTGGRATIPGGSWELERKARTAHRMIQAALDPVFDTKLTTRLANLHPLPRVAWWSRAKAGVGALSGPAHAAAQALLVELAQPAIQTERLLARWQRGRVEATREKQRAARRESLTTYSLAALFIAFWIVVIGATITSC